MEAKKLNPTQDRLESSILKQIREVDEAILNTEEQIINLEIKLKEKREDLIFLQGKADAFQQALNEIREEIPEEGEL